jgi:hypothetical protein
MILSSCNRHHHREKSIFELIGLIMGLAVFLLVFSPPRRQARVADHHNKSLNFAVHNLVWSY